jgi:hypothetical protein
MIDHELMTKALCIHPCVQEQMYVLDTVLAPCIPDDETRLDITVALIGLIGTIAAHIAAPVSPTTTAN